MPSDIKLQSEGVTPMGLVPGAGGAPTGHVRAGMAAGSGRASKGQTVQFAGVLVHPVDGSETQNEATLAPRRSARVAVAASGAAAPAVLSATVPSGGQSVKPGPRGPGSTGLQGVRRLSPSYLTMCSADGASVSAGTPEDQLRERAARLQERAARLQHLRNRAGGFEPHPG